MAIRIEGVIKTFERMRRQKKTHEEKQRGAGDLQRGMAGDRNGHVFILVVLCVCMYVRVHVCVCIHVEVTDQTPMSSSSVLPFLFPETGFLYKALADLELTI